VNPASLPYPGKHPEHPRLWFLDSDVHLTSPIPGELPSNQLLWLNDETMRNPSPRHA